MANKQSYKYYEVTGDVAVYIALFLLCLAVPLLALVLKKRLSDNCFFK